MDYYQQAIAIQNETIAHRRYFHQNAETGTEMPLATAYVRKTLESYGIRTQSCAGGVVGFIGQGNSTILLRADMDALPMTEQSGLPFSSTNGCCHACGHDLHAAMLLTAAKLLKSNEMQLTGRVCLMFQPGEELLVGAKQMLSAGILEIYKPDAALALHVGPGGRGGECWYNADTPMMLSCDAFRITIEGHGGHGGYPQMTIDPIGTAVQIYHALQHLVNYETDPQQTVSFSIGNLHSGNAYNIIPETAVMEGSFRTSNAETREHLKTRMQEIALQIGKANRCRIQISMLAETPPLRCDHQFTNEIVKILKGILDIQFIPGLRSSASDDFAELSSRIPAAYLFLSAGVPGCTNSSHHPAVQYNENVLPLGATVLAHAADGWLRLSEQNHSVYNSTSS